MGSDSGNARPSRKSPIIPHYAEDWELFSVLLLEPRARCYGRRAPPARSALLAVVALVALAAVVAVVSAVRATVPALEVHLHRVVREDFLGRVRAHAEGLCGATDEFARGLCGCEILNDNRLECASLDRVEKRLRDGGSAPGARSHCLLVSDVVEAEGGSGGLSHDVSSLFCV